MRLITQGLPFARLVFLLLMGGGLFLGAQESIAQTPGEDRVPPIEHILVPGGSGVTGLDIQPYTARWRQTVHKPDGTSRPGINVIRDSVSVDVEAGPDGRIHRLLRWLDVNGNTYDRLDIMDRRSLAPILMDIRSNPSSVTHVDFDGLDVRATSIGSMDASARMVEGRMNEPGFSWSSDGFLLAAMAMGSEPLFKIQVVSNLTKAPTTNHIPFQVLGEETVETIPFGRHETRVIKHLNPGGYWGQYWVSSQAPYVVKVQFTQSNGTITVWELF